MNIRTISSTALLCALVTGCGGGGGSSPSPSSAEPVTATAPATPATPTTPATPATPPPAETTPPPTSVTVPVTSTNQLSASADFDLASTEDVVVNIDVRGLGNSNGYLSICGGLPDEQPDYDNCFVRAAIPDATYTGTLTLSSATQVAYSAIWFLDMSLPEVVTRHDLDERQIQLSL